MIKFFRKIRQRLLNENRFSKYLIYAIGEIALVIIGILIALNINSRAELKKTESKIDKLFENVLDELQTNINSTTTLAKRYSTFDSLHFRIMQDKITLKDYKDRSHFELFTLTTRIRKAQLTHDAYDNLIANRNDVPVKYEQVMKDLISLYVIKSLVDEYDKKMEELVYKTLTERADKFEWFTRNSWPQDNEKEIDYYLNDFRYRNELTNYWTYSIGNQVSIAMRFRENAIRLYGDISELLGEQQKPPTEAIEPQVSEMLLGTWNSDSTSIRIKFSLKDRGLYTDITRNDTINSHDELLILKHSKNYVKGIVCALDSEVLVRPTYHSFTVKNDSLFLEENYSSFVLTKVNDQ